MTGYILQVILFQLLFLGVYEVMLKKETFFSYNRWYLLATSVISLLLPLVNIGALAFLVPAEAIPEITTVWLPEVLIGDTPAAAQTSATTETAGEMLRINWWLVAYGTGVLASLFIFFKKYQNLSRLFRFRTLSAERDLRIIEVPNSTIACTFYKTIFLGDKLSEAEKQQILSHELVHVKQKHSLDLVFFEVYKIIFWFNPLIYIYQERISTLHEFIADAVVVKTTGKRSYYEQLLNTAFNTRNISFINQFFDHSLIKKRIVMLQKPRSKTAAKIKYLALLPLILLMLSFVSYSGTGMSSGETFNVHTPGINGEESIINSVSPPQLNIPFAVVEQIPVYPGCEAENGEAGKECFSKNLKDYVNRNFNTLAVKPYLKEGSNRLVVVFTISSSGEITGAKSRMVTPGVAVEDKAVVEEEAIRVVQSLPKMKPGNHEGKTVGVSYSLPVEIFIPGEED